MIIELDEIEKKYTRTRPILNLTRALAVSGLVASPVLLALTIMLPASPPFDNKLIMVFFHISSIVIILSFSISILVLNRFALLFFGLYFALLAFLTVYEQRSRLHLPSDLPKLAFDAIVLLPLVWYITMSLSALTSVMLSPAERNIFKDAFLRKWLVGKSLDYFHMPTVGHISMLRQLKVFGLIGLGSSLLGFGFVSVGALAWIAHQFANDFAIAIREGSALQVPLAPCFRYYFVLCRS